MPKDPVMLLSYVNTQLRDFYSSLSAMCEDKQCSVEEITAKLAGIDYEYDAARNQLFLFCRKSCDACRRRQSIDIISVEY